MNIDDHPVTALTRAAAESAGMNWSATLPSEPDGKWHFAIWPKGSPPPSDDG